MKSKVDELRDSVGIYDHPNVWIVKNGGTEDDFYIDNISSSVHDSILTDEQAFLRDLDTALTCLKLVLYNRPEDVDYGQVIKKIGKLMEVLVSVDYKKQHEDKHTK
jgi:hypothetical protein